LASQPMFVKNKTGMSDMSDMAPTDTIATTILRTADGLKLSAVGTLSSSTSGCSHRPLACTDSPDNRVRYRFDSNSPIIVVLCCDQTRPGQILANHVSLLGWKITRWL
jgi:hypothetical protein